MTRPRHRAAVPRRPFRLGGGLGALALVVGLALPPAIAQTTASWNDTEWVRGRVGTIDCTTGTGITSSAAGRLVNAQIGATSLDSVVALRGVVSTSDGTKATTATPAPPTSSSAGTDAFRVPLSATTLGGLALNASVGLPLAFGTGAYDQYALASKNGHAIGASGVITNGGAVDLTALGSGRPDLGTLSLSNLPGLGPLLTGLSDVNLTIGAVASSAEIQGCSFLWNQATSAIQRSYHVAGLRLTATSPAVATLGTLAATEVAGIISSIGTGVTSTVSAVNTAVVTNLATIITNLLNGAGLLGISVQNVTPSVTLTIDTAPLGALANPTLGGAVQANLPAGGLTVDLAALLGSVNSDSNGLNGRTSNTEVLSADVMNALLTRLSASLSSWVSSVSPAVSKVIYDGRLRIVVPVKLRAIGIDVIDLNITIDTTLGGLLGVNATPAYAAPTITVNAQLISGVTSIPAVGLIVNSLLNPVVALLNSSLEASLRTLLLPAIRTAVTQTLIEPLLGNGSSTTGSVGAAVTRLTTGVTTLITALGPVLDRLRSLVSVTVNARPDASPHPAAFESGPTSGRYSVSALRVAAVNTSGTSLLTLHLASSRVGPVGVAP